MLTQTNKNRYTILLRVLALPVMIISFFSGVGYSQKIIIRDATSKPQKEIKDTARYSLQSQVIDDTIFSIQKAVLTDSITPRPQYHIGGDILKVRRVIVRDSVANRTQNGKILRDTMISQRNFFRRDSIAIDPRKTITIIQDSAVVGVLRPNEWFKIPGIEGAKEMRLEILNRWQKVIYEKNSYTNTVEDGWKGNGVNAGTYFYKLVGIDANNKKLEHMGYIQVIK